MIDMFSSIKRHHYCPMYLKSIYPGTPIFSTNKNNRHDIPEILFKVVLNTITLILTLES